MKYKLKKEARQFFPRLEKDIKPIEYWNKEKVHENLLDKAEGVHIEYGIRENANSMTLQGWAHDNGDTKAHFDFTIHINDISLDNYKKVYVPDLMDEMQKVVNIFMKRYAD